MGTPEILLNTESDKGVVPANETPVTVMTKLNFPAMLIGSYYQGLELLQTIKGTVDLLQSFNYNKTIL